MGYSKTQYIHTILKDINTIFTIFKMTRLSNCTVCDSDPFYYMAMTPFLMTPTAAATLSPNKDQNAATLDKG